MQRLRELRKFNKLTARELGSILGYAESTILQWERGTRAPDSSALLTIADYFRVSLDYLLGRKNYESVMEAIGSYEASNLVRVPLFEHYPHFINDSNYSLTDNTIDISPKSLSNIEYPFAITATDDTMAPTILKDDLVILGVCKDVADRDIVLFNTNQDVRLGRLNIHDKNIILTFDRVGANLIVERLDTKKIIAKVIEIRRTFK